MSVQPERLKDSDSDEEDSRCRCTRWSGRSIREKRLIVVIVVLAVIIFSLAVAIIVIGCENTDLNERVNDLKSSKICVSQSCINSASYILDAINTSTDPCEDFYTFGCGNWMKNNPIPEDEVSFGVSDFVTTNVEKQLKELLSAPVTNSDPEAVAKAKSMYKVCLNEEKVEELAIKNTLKALSDRYGGWPIIAENTNVDNFDWISVEASFIRSDREAAALVSLDVLSDETNATRKSIYLDQPTFGLDRGYLLSPEKYPTEIAEYKMYMFAIAMHFSKTNEISQALVKDVNDIIELEKLIANISEPSPLHLRRRRAAHFSKVTIKKLQSLTDEIYVNLSLSANHITWLRLVQEVFKDIWTITENEPILAERDYLDKLGPLLDKTSKRWKQCIQEVDKNLGMAVGNLFVQSSFSTSSKMEVDEMFHEIRDVFIEMVDDVDWMNTNEKELIQKKAKAITSVSGYHDWILNSTALNQYYEKVTVDDLDHEANMRLAAETNMWRVLHSLRDNRTDKTASSWNISPAAVNAAYFPDVNFVEFTAAILQPPFLKAGRMKALNYGFTGSTVGHEITHAFDEEGRKYDENGVLVDWWTNKTLSNLKEKDDCYGQQYQVFCEPNALGAETCIDGNQTLGENIADNGGLKAAYKGYRRWVSKNKEELKLPGLDLTPDQLFFVAYALSFCNNDGPGAAAALMVTDGHSPDKYRVLGAVANSKEFAKAYNCPTSSAMNRGSERCEMW